MSEEIPVNRMGEAHPAAGGGQSPSLVKRRDDGNPLVLVAGGMGVYWIWYLVYLLGTTSAKFLLSLVFIIAGLWMAGRGMIGVMKISIYVAAVIVAVLNLVGIVVFLLVASRFWIEPELADVPGASGGAGILWSLVAVPVFLGFALLNLMWAILVSFVCKWKEMRRLALAFLPIPVMWLAALYFDGVHHGS